MEPFTGTILQSKMTICYVARGVSKTTEIKQTLRTAVVCSQRGGRYSTILSSFTYPLVITQPSIAYSIKIDHDHHISFVCVFLHTGLMSLQKVVFPASTERLQHHYY